MSHGGPEALGPRHNEIKRLRGLLREPAARAAESVFVLEGPKLVADALRRGVVLDSIFLGPNARSSFHALLDLPRDDDVAVFDLKEGVLEKLGSTRTPQPVLAVAVIPRRPQVAELDGAGPVLVAVGVADPGNLGTLLRSAEASGCAGVVCCGDSVDVYNPKVVRASAGSVMGVSIVERRGPGGAGEAGDPALVLDELAAQGRTRYGAATEGVPAYDVNLARPVAFVLGNEAHGLSERVLEHVDGLVSIPMAGEAESLNVATAGSVLAFEAARQRTAR